ncbi:MAG: DNA methyltransferase [Actinomycetota bacterium]
MDDSWKNRLYFGDNLRIMRDYISDESVDLVYLDPPFNSQATYNVLYQEKNGTSSAAQIEAFEDTWHWDIKAAATYQELVETAPKKLSDLMQALYQFLGHNDMMAYLTMMAIRLQELHRVLKPTGSIFLHCDPTASHYLKLVMDAIFSPKYFINEIIWKRTSAKSLAFTRFASNHDVLLHYAKGDKPTWNPQYMEHDPEYIKKFYRFIEPETGRQYRLGDLTNPNKDRPNLTYEFLGVTRVWRWTKDRMQKAYDEGLVVQSKPGTVPALKRYLDEQEGTPVDDIWSDIKPVQPQAAERLGYPTQKPEMLLERIIEARSNQGDIVLDPFCGCGTTISVAERLHRHWIGIDITHLAITLIKRRLEDHFADDLQPYEVIGDPKDLPGAVELASQDKFQFEWWALDLVGARPAQDKKKGADTGIDGYIYFFDDDSGKAKQVVVQVKGGTIHSSHIRDLKGVVEREKAAIGAFVTLKPATKPMREEAAAAGFYDSPHYGKFPKLQILTIEELLGGKTLQMPPRRQVDKTFKKAEKKVKKREDQTGLF